MAAREANERDPSKNVQTSELQRPQPPRIDPHRPSPGRELQSFENIDRLLHALQANLTGSISPAAVQAARLDWWAHFLNAPGFQVALAQRALMDAFRLGLYALRAVSGQDLGPIPFAAEHDRRFAGDEWRVFPFNVMAATFLAIQAWWDTASRSLRGPTRQHVRQVAFMRRQALDVLSPSNYPLTNPEVLKRTQAENGQNLIRGLQYFLEDFENRLTGRPPAGSEAWRVGENLATTPGQVVYRNDLSS